MPPPEPALTVQTAAPLRIAIPIVVPSTERCTAQGTGEIVVCASNPEAYRLRPLPGTDHEQPSRAELKLAPGVAAGVAVEGGSVGGTPSNRIKATVHIAF